MAAEAAGFDAASLAEVDACMERMTEIWWHCSQLRPAYLSYLAHAALPEDSGQLQLWCDIAADILPQLDDGSRAVLVSE